MDMESILCDIEELNCRLICKLKCEFEKGLDCVDAAEAGEVTDMIKDLAETKRNLCEAIYYETVTEAMEEAGHDHYGYNPNRYASGRYAPTGRGRKGYVPYIDMYLDNPNEMVRMGYHGKHEEMAMRDLSI